MSLFSNLKMSHHQKIQQTLTHIQDLAMTGRPTMQIQMKQGDLHCTRRKIFTRVLLLHLPWSSDLEQMKTLTQLPTVEMKALKLAQMVI